MAWFRNHYRCENCGQEWEDEWSATCDDDCPHCGARHMEPCDSVDLTTTIEELEGSFLVYRSPDSAEESPGYELIAECDSCEEAEQLLRDGGKETGGPAGIVVNRI